MKIKVQKIAFDELKQKALDVHNEYYESRAEKAGNFHLELKMEDVPEDILQEWMIALIQDEMISVEDVESITDDVKIAVLKEIKEVYPELKNEINRHISVFEARKTNK